MQRACQFRTFVVVQPASQSEARSTETTSFDLAGVRNDIQAFNSYAIMVDCGLAHDGIEIKSKIYSQKSDSLFRVQRQLTTIPPLRSCRVGKSRTAKVVDLQNPRSISLPLYLIPTKQR